MFEQWVAKIKTSLMSFLMKGSVGDRVDPLAAEMGLFEIESRGKVVDASLMVDADDESSISLVQSLTGGIGEFTDYHFPPELIGGCCPRVIGEEQEIVWNAAAEAADTERVHVVWQVKDDKIYYIAVNSEAMASCPNTWCPFASLLPGMVDAAVPPTIYTYFSDEAATMMTVTADSLHIHRGTASVVRAKAERMAREFDNAPVVELVPDHINQLQPVPWLSISLFEDRARRILSTFAVLSALVFGVVAVFIWLVAGMSAVKSHGNLAEIEERTKEKTLALMRSVQEQRASPMREQLAQFSDLNDGLIELNGFLEVYQIKRGRTLWRAVVPTNVTSDRIRDLGGQTLGNSQYGVVIGNARDALDVGTGKEKDGRR